MSWSSSSNSQKVLIKGKKWMEQGMGMALSITMKEGNIRVTGTTTKWMAMVHFTILTVGLPIKGSGKTMPFMEREFWTMRSPTTLKETMTFPRSTSAKTNNFGSTMTAGLRMIRNLATESWFSAMDRNMSVNSRTTWSTAKASSI